MVFTTMKKATNTHIQHLLNGLALEEKAQQERYNIKDFSGIKQLKREGLALHPIKIGRKSYGFAEYPECSFKVPLSQDTGNFRDGATVEIFFDNEPAIKGTLLGLEGTNGEVRLFAPDYPDWIDENGVGIKLTPDTKTTEIISEVLLELDTEQNAVALPFFNYIYNADKSKLPQTVKYNLDKIHFLNSSQQEAVEKINGHEPLVIIHGPPGTGKTTTLVEAIAALVKNGEKVLVTAPSNTATDHIAMQLVKKGIATIRIGNQTKINAQLLPHTIEGKLAQGNEQQELKKMRIQAESFRKMAHQYKRHFGKAEREQRKLLMQEVKNIRKEIRSLQNYSAEKWLKEASVVCGTPIGLNDATLKNFKFNTLVIDEAGQCLESLAWVAIKNVERLVLAGDHLQLPPTIISEEAIKKGHNTSFLEVVLKRKNETCLLDTQYRMRESIANFPNKYFYEGKLKTPEKLRNTTQHFLFYDTAGTGFQEEQSPEQGSLTNSSEIEIISKLLATGNYTINNAAFISPYSGQVALAKEKLPKNLRISTIDSFQGQECDTIFISLVRSNDEGVLGFLKDYRRMNVALTRAKEQLIVVGDSVTFSTDKFFSSFLEHCQQNNAYHSAWELL
jgi:superfamily I DNA and/or RNA helicase